MSITINKLCYIHSDRKLLFQNISFSVSKGQKVSLVGDNGSGKSTLLRVISGHLPTGSGSVILSDKPYYIPQHFGQYDDLLVSEVLGVDSKINALKLIEKGDFSIQNFELLNDDWSIEERVLSAFSSWNIEHVKLSQKMREFSGGEKTKIFLAGIAIHSPSIILLDEPSNHLDGESRERLYKFIKTSSATMIVASHDRILLNLINTTYELTKDAINTYGGNYEFYKEQKDIQITALYAQLDDRLKELRMARKASQEAAERKQKLDARGNKKQIGEGAPRILMNTLRNRAEQSASKLKEVHSDKIGSIVDDLKQIKDRVPDDIHLSLKLENTNLHNGKILVSAKDVNFKYGSENIWVDSLDFQIKSGERIAIRGKNGSGKTTLLRLILGELFPTKGELYRADFNNLYVDQEYSLIDNNLTVFEQVRMYNPRHLLEHELKMMLHHFQFTYHTWDKTCDMLSGGEKMKLIFCCLMISNDAPDVFILDEPTNNLDIQSLSIVVSSLKNYKGTVLVISHDQYFIDEIGITRFIEL